MDTQDIPVKKPTEIEKQIWDRLRPTKMSGLIRNKAFVFKDAVSWDDWYRNPDPMVPNDYESKMLAGCRGEWFASIVESRKRVLDVGCGFGFPSFYLAQYDHGVVGIDVSQSEIEMAQLISERMGKPENIRFSVFDGANLPFEDHSFDAATLGSSLECMGDPAAVMQELKRVLKPGSPIAIEEEDRSKDPRTHPVWEKRRWAFFDSEIWLWYELRIYDPDMDRRYMLKIDPRGRIADQLRSTERIVLERDRGLPIESFDSTDIAFDSALNETVYAEYAEAMGFGPVTLQAFLLDMGLVNIQFFLQPDGRAFAQSLLSQNLLSEMPANVRGVLRALVHSVPSMPDPISAMVSAFAPDT